MTWYEAIAFCAWLSEVLEQEVRLPTEAEWERAARHTDGRVYPWVGAFDAQRCNMADTGIGAPSAVGMFPSGQAECGAADMAGNVWEWCSTKSLDDYKNYEQRVDDNLDGGAARVGRGGAFYNLEDVVRCACGNWFNPDYCFNGQGFRVVSPGL